MSAAGFGYACAVVLAVVFIAAAVAKLRDPQATASSFADLGLPAAGPAARAVPVTEAVTAAFLLAWPVMGGLFGLTMLAFFTTFLVTRLRAGVRAPCSCFGAARSAPLSRANLVGNGFLLVLAAAAVLAPAPTRPTPLDVVVLVAVIGVEVVVHALVRRADDGAPAPRSVTSTP